MSDLRQRVHEPAPEVWPSLRPPRPHPVRRAAAMAAIQYVAKDLPAVLELDGRSFGRGGPVMEVHRPGPFLDRLGRDAGTGFGESYLAGDWDPGPDTDLADLLLPFAERFSPEQDSGLVPQWAQSLRGLATRDTSCRQNNDRYRARENVSRHYDLDNAMFAEVPRPVDDLLVRDVRAAPARGLGVVRRPLDGPAAQARRGARRRRGPRRVPGAGHRVRLGQPRDPGGAARRVGDRDLGGLRAGADGAAAGAGARASATG